MDFNPKNRPTVMAAVLKLLKERKELKRQNEELLLKLRLDKEIKKLFVDYKIINGMGTDDRKKLLKDLEKLTEGSDKMFELD